MAKGIKKLLFVRKGFVCQYLPAGVFNGDGKMPYEVKWLAENHIILVKVIGDISAHEVAPTDDQIVELIEASTADMVHVIFDDSQAGKLPEARFFSDIKWVKHPRVGWNISIEAQNALHRFFSRFVTQYFQLRSRNLMTLGEAVAYLKQVDPSLEAIEINTQP